MDLSTSGERHSAIPAVHVQYRQYFRPASILRSAIYSVLRWGWAAWHHGLMKAYSKDLRQKIVDAIERGMPKAQAARTFGVGISTVKRYATKAQRGESLEPGKAPGKPPKIDERVGKLLEADLEERPFATLRERCDYVEAISGVSVSRSTMCRAIARIGSTRKKGGERPQSETSF